MSRYYSRVRIEARADALDCMAGKGAPRKTREKTKTAPSPGLSVMKEAAVLVKEIGVDVATALQIVRGVRAEPREATTENPKGPRLVV